MLERADFDSGSESILYGQIHTLSRGPNQTCLTTGHTQTLRLSQAMSHLCTVWKRVYRGTCYTALCQCSRDSMGFVVYIMLAVYFNNSENSHNCEHYYKKGKIYAFITIYKRSTPRTGLLSLDERKSVCASSHLSTCIDFSRRAYSIHFNTNRMLLGKLPLCAMLLELAVAIACKTTVQYVVMSQCAGM